MINLTFPDGAQSQVEAGLSARDVAASISKSLEKKAVAAVVNGTLVDLADPILTDSTLKIVTRDDPRALELIRHDAAHVLAEAVQELFPGTQVTIGPVIENGFYYDFFRNEPFTPEDFAAIEKKMREIIQRDKPFTKSVKTREEAKAFFRDKGEMFKVELVDAIPGNEDIKFYDQGGWIDLCRGPHMTSTGKIGNAFKLMKVAGAYWRGDSKNPMLTRIYGTAWANDKDLQGLYHGAGRSREARPPQAWPRDGPVPFPGRRAGRGVLARQGLDHVPAADRLHAPPPRKLDYQEVNAPQLLDKSLWETSGHWGWYKEAMFAATSAGETTEDDQVFAIKPMNCPGPRADLQARLALLSRTCRCGLRSSAMSTAMSRRAHFTA